MSQFQQTENERRLHNVLKFGRIIEHKRNLYRVAFGTNKTCTHWMPRLIQNAYVEINQVKYMLKSSAYKTGDEVAFLLDSGGDATGVILGRVQRCEEPIYIKEC